MGIRERDTPGTGVWDGKGFHRHPMHLEPGPALGKSTGDGGLRQEEKASCPIPLVLLDVLMIYHSLMTAFINTSK